MSELLAKRGWSIDISLKQPVPGQLAHGLIGSRVGFFGPLLADSAMSPCTIDHDRNTVA